MNLKASGNRISGLLALMLFLIFSICILGVLLSTADAYQRLSERNALSGDRRTGMMFVSTKVRQCDRAGSIYAGEFDGTSALYLTEVLEGERYKTILYCHDGYLYELFAPESLAAERGDGEPILPAEAFSASVQNGLLTVSLTALDGEVTTQALCIRSGEVSE